MPGPAGITRGGWCGQPAASASSPALSELEGRLPDVDTLVRDLDAAGYLTDQPLGVALFLAARMGQPILLEGEPSVGKTEAA